MSFFSTIKDFNRQWEVVREDAKERRRLVAQHSITQFHNHFAVAMKCPVAWTTDDELTKFWMDFTLHGEFEDEEIDKMKSCVARQGFDINVTTVSGHWIKVRVEGSVFP
jgi:hypothetical protein